MFRVCLERFWSMLEGVLACFWSMFGSILHGFILHEVCLGCVVGGVNCETIATDPSSSMTSKKCVGISLEHFSYVQGVGGLCWRGCEL